MKILKRFKHATFSSSVWYANHSATETWYNKMLEQFDKKIEEEENKFFYKCSFRAAYLAENFVYITDTNLENNKSVKFCLNKFEIFPPLFPIKGLRGCPTKVKSTILRKDE